jgi:hypothetical protein
MGGRSLASRAMGGSSFVGDPRLERDGTSNRSEAVEPARLAGEAE